MRANTLVYDRKTSHFDRERNPKPKPQLEAGRHWLDRNTGGITVGPKQRLGRRLRERVSYYLVPGIPDQGEAPIGFFNQSGAVVEPITGIAIGDLSLA